VATQDRERWPGLPELLGGAENNRKVSRYLLPAWHSMFQEIVVSHNGIMTPGLIRGNFDKLGISFLLVNFAYAYFVAAVDLVFSGQLPSCYAVLRMCLESVVYAHAIVASPELGAIWMLRDDTPTDKDRFRRDFKITNLINALPEGDPVPRTAVDELYKTTISYGGHPNRDGVLAVGRWIRSKQLERVEIGLFTTGTPLLLALKVAAEIGYVMVTLEGVAFGVQLAPASFPERLQQLCKQGLPGELAQETGSLANL
jgi:hypothetical protein